MVDKNFFPTMNSVKELSKCVKNRIGIYAYNRNTTDPRNIIRSTYSQTLSDKNCNGCTGTCEYVDIFGVTLVELMAKITDISTVKLFVTSVDSDGKLTDPLEGNLSTLKFIFHTGIISVSVLTEDGEKVYTRKVMRELLNQI